MKRTIVQRLVTATGALVTALALGAFAQAAPFSLSFDSSADMAKLQQIIPADAKVSHGSVVDGLLLVKDQGGYVVKELKFGDGTIEFDLRLEDSAAGWAGVQIRRATARDGVASSGYSICFQSDTAVFIYKGGPNQGYNAVQYKKFEKAGTVKIVAEGSDIVVYVDDKLATAFTDESFTVGGVALWALASNSVWFDNLVIDAK